MRNEKEQKHYDVDRARDAEVAASADATNSGEQPPEKHKERVDAAHAKAKADHDAIDKQADTAKG